MVSFFGTCFFSILRRNVTPSFPCLYPISLMRDSDAIFFSLLKLEIFIDAHLPDEFIEMRDEYHRPLILIERLRDDR